MIDAAAPPDPASGMYALAATVVTSAAWFLVNRRTRTDQATSTTLADAEADQAAAALVASATKLATTALSELSAVKATVADLAAQLERCEERHATTEAALLAAGIALPSHD